MPVSAASMIEARFEGGPTGSGPAQCPVGPAKLFLDGADNCAVCASSVELARAAVATLARVGTQGLAVLRAASAMQGLRRGSDGLWHQGVSFWRTDELARAISRSAGAGLQVAQHALGNEAVAQALDAIERSGAALDALPGSPRLEHAVLLDPELERRMADAGVSAVVQPSYIRDVGDRLRLLSYPGALRPVGFRSLLDAGVSLAGSSDYPVTRYEPLPAIGDAVTRRTLSGATLLDEEAITVEEALAMYTLEAARALGVERETGSLAEGKRADLVVLDADPREVAPDRLGEVRVLRTYVGGELAWPTMAEPGHR
jgi:predicted amidohydrolase YtcJ